jgi:hypothetical protein
VFLLYVRQGVKVSVGNRYQRRSTLRFMRCGAQPCACRLVGEGVGRLAKPHNQN